MRKNDSDQIILNFKKWFKEDLIEKHIKNAEKCRNYDAFKINPLLLFYLSNTIPPCLLHS